MCHFSHLASTSFPWLLGVCFGELSFGAFLDCLAGELRERVDGFPRCLDRFTSAPSLLSWPGRPLPFVLIDDSSTRWAFGAVIAIGRRDVGIELRAIVVIIAHTVSWIDLSF